MLLVYRQSSGRSCGIRYFGYNVHVLFNIFSLCINLFETAVVSGLERKHGKWVQAWTKDIGDVRKSIQS